MASRPRFAGTRLRLILAVAGATAAFSASGCSEGPVDPAETLVGPTIGSQGGEISLPGIALAEFPVGFFTTPRVVELTRGEDQSSLSAFEESQGLFRVEGRLAYQVRIVAGSTSPSGEAFFVRLTVPGSLVVGTGSRPDLFAQVYQDGGQEVLDNFEPFPAEWNPTSRTLTASLPAYVFTDARRSDGIFES